MPSIARGIKSLIVVLVTGTSFLTFTLLSLDAIPALHLTHRFLRNDIRGHVTQLLTFTDAPNITSPTKTSTNESYQPVYLINQPNICSAGPNSTGNVTTPPSLALVYIHTKPSHFHRRAFLRRTWADPYFKARFDYTTVFILGDPKNISVQEKLVNESRTFHDIIQADFHDVYENLTLKEITGLHWTTAYCNQTSFVVKADDDLIIKPWLLSALFHKYLNVSWKPSVYCRKWDKPSPHRDKKSKWYVPTSVYPHRYYPAFCSGPSRIMTKEAVPLLYEGTQKLPFFWLEDVFVTGIVAQHMNVTRFDEPAYLEDTVAKKQASSVVAIAHAFALSNQRRIWRDIIRKFPEYFSGRNQSDFNASPADDVNDWITVAECYIFYCSKM